MMNSSRDFPDLPHGSIEEQAADWLSRRDAGLTVVEQEAFSAWLLADPRHAAAAQDVEQSYRLLANVRHGGHTDEIIHEIEQRVGQRRRRRLLATLSVVGLAAAAAIAFVAWPSKSATPAPATIAAGTMQLKPELRTLPDGSIVELNASAEISIDFHPTQRSVRLLRGTAHFAVAKNPQRPFIVSAGSVSVRAVGTEFEVRLDPKEVDVLVTEGRVAVERSSTNVSQSAAPSFLDAGQRAVVPIENPAESVQVQPVAPHTIQIAQAWRSMRVEFTDMKLREVVELFNRQNKLQLIPGDKVVGDLLVSGVFWLDDPEGFSRLIESSARLQGGRDGPDRIILRQP